MLGGYVCSGNCVQSLIRLPTTNINVIYIANPFCGYIPWYYSVFIHRKVTKSRVFTILAAILPKTHVHGGYVCSGNCVKPSIWLTTTHSNLVCTANRFCGHIPWCCSVVGYQKVMKNYILATFQPILYPKLTCTAAMYAPGIVYNLQYDSPQPIAMWFT